MGFFSKITRAITKPIKKIIKSPLGKAALIGGLGYLTMGGGPGLGLQNKGWMNALKAGWKGLPNVGGGGTDLYTGLPGLLYKGAGFAARNKVPLAIAGAAGLGTAAMAAGQPKVDELQGFGDEGKGHQAYLRARSFMPFGDESSPHYTAPMWTGSQGGRVRAQEGMYAGQGIASLQGAEADMSTVNQPTEQGVLDSGTTEQSDDARLIQLIQQLASLGIPMEQLRGRTEQELVEMMVYLSSQMGSQQGGGRAQMAEGGDTPEYKGWKQMYELNADAAAEHPRHEEFITIYESERSKMARGGVNSLFLEESSEVMRGGEDGDSVVDETENIEVASGPYEGTAADADEHSYRMFGKPYNALNEIELEEFRMEMERLQSKFMNQGGIARTAYAMGTEHPVIPSKDGKQLDMRNTGGYQPHGKAEKHDDVRALLAQGEFVMTSDAVKGLGGGDREAGAKKMYDMMHNLEAMA